MQHTCEAVALKCRPWFGSFFPVPFSHTHTYHVLLPLVISMSHGTFVNLLRRIRKNRNASAVNGMRSSGGQAVIHQPCMQERQRECCELLHVSVSVARQSPWIRTRIPCTCLCSSMLPLSIALSRPSLHALLLSLFPWTPLSSFNSLSPSLF